MATPPSVGEVLFGSTRRAVLGLLFTRPDDRFSLREIARRTGTSPGGVQRELRQLEACGLLTRDRHLMYTVNADSPAYAPLRDLLTATAGVADRLRAALVEGGADLACAFVFGSFARGEHRGASDIDLFVVTTTGAAPELPGLSELQARLGREINPFVLPADELRGKVRAGNAFVTRVLAGDKVFVIGTADELERLVEERVGPPSRADGRRDRRPARRRRA